MCTAGLQREKHLLPACPACPGWPSKLCDVEWNDTADAEWKEFKKQPRGESSFQDELVPVKGTRRQFMMKLQATFENYKKHIWEDRW